MIRKFSRAKYLIPPLAGLTLLAGCTYGNVADIRALKTEDGSFADALSTEYRRLALYEADDMVDWVDADYFARKGLDSASGVIREPEPIEDWDIDRNKISELQAARKRLITFLKTGAGDVLPQQVAAAQAQFDCWLEQQEEGWQENHIAKCRDGFYAAIADIEPNIKPKTTIFFEFDSEVMEEEERNKLTAFAKYVDMFDTGALVIDGHADRAGTKPHNQSLSWGRAEAVRHELIKAGIAPERIAISAWGENAPVVPTNDGVREQRNRRTEVELRLPPLYATIAPGSEMASVAE